MSHIPAWLLAKNEAKLKEKGHNTVTVVTVTQQTIRTAMVQSARPMMVQLPEIEQHEYDGAPVWCDDMGDDFAPERGMISTM